VSRIARRTRTAAALGAVAFAAAAITVAPAAGATIVAGTIAYDAPATTRLLTLVNAHRAAIGLAAVTTDAALADVARGWTLSMATTQTLAHNDALFTRATHTGLGIGTFGENVAYSSVSLDDAHDALMHSPHHLANIETPSFALAGFAVAVDVRGWFWVTEDFGTARRTAAAASARVVAVPAHAPRVVDRPAVRRVVPRVAARPVARAAKRVVRTAVARPAVAREPVAREPASVPLAAATGAAPASATALSLLAALLAAALCAAYGRLVLAPHA
jgi:uncharacterized protein YkwD